MLYEMSAFEKRDLTLNSLEVCYAEPQGSVGEVEFIVHRKY